MITTYFSPEKMTYTGPELRPHFILSRFKIEGDALIAFRGPCAVMTDHLVDWEDRLNQDFIRAGEMVHFLGEFFGMTLKEGIWIQRLVVSELLSMLLKRGIAANRVGDDLFVGSGKLSVSIVTASPVSILFHLGINVDPTGAPVEAVGLGSILKSDEINPWVQAVLDWFQQEFLSVSRAAVKVRPVI